MYFFTAACQKRSFVKMLESLNHKIRFNDSARHPGARNLQENRLPGTLVRERPAAVNKAASAFCGSQRFK
ncbi:hypothetical protein LJC15_01950 [Desulfovibrio sp. OttesenSCG-928-G11]|nr:hypothetical protein [Desulfovibrio sp. OttesenSCG-928-G11]